MRLLSETAPVLKAGYLIIVAAARLPNLVRCALEAGAPPNTSLPPLNKNALTEMALVGDVRILRLLLEAGADHRLMDTDGFTPLLAAAQEGHLACIQVLLSAGADANQTDTLGNTPLASAIGNRRTECARALLSSTNLLATNRAGESAIHVAARFANQECFELLLPLMSDVDQRTVPVFDNDGQLTDSTFNLTTLHCACTRGQQQMARALLKRGANRMARDSMQRTPLHDAASRGHLSCCVLLVGQPGRRKMTPEEVDAVDMQGATALHHSAQTGNEKICGFLIEAGAQLDLRSSHGGTPLAIALHFHPTNVALLALLAGAGPAQPPGTVCDHCGKTAAQASVNNLKACAQCHAVRYCGAACGAAAWPGHKKACRARAKELEEAAKPKLIPAGQAAAGPSQS